MRAVTVLAIGLCLGSAAALAQPKSAGAPDARLIEDLVVANRVLADQGVLDGFGHVARFIHGEIYKARPEEAVAAENTNDAPVMRPWERWKRKAMKPE